MLRTARFCYCCGQQDFSTAVAAAFGFGVAAVEVAAVNDSAGALVVGVVSPELLLVVFTFQIADEEVVDADFPPLGSIVATDGGFATPVENRDGGAGQNSAGGGCSNVAVYSCIHLRYLCCCAAGIPSPRTSQSFCTIFRKVRI